MNLKTEKKTEKVEEKKPDTEEHTLYDSTDVQLKNAAMLLDSRRVATLDQGQ